MADIERLYDRHLLEEATEGFKTFSRRYDEISDEDNVNAMVEFLRRLPTDDRTKKRELANFFQNDETGKYDSTRRREAYDSLLGRDRNRRT